MSCYVHPSSCFRTLSLVTFCLICTVLKTNARYPINGYAQLPQLVETADNDMLPIEVDTPAYIRLFGNNEPSNIVDKVNSLRRTEINIVPASDGLQLQDQNVREQVQNVRKRKSVDDGQSCVKVCFICCYIFK